MDECTLNDLLECSVCLERLDTSSKVLPCQHTFCKKCLEEIISTHKELRCPECRILVDCKIEELPPNVLLMRILEGMKNASNGTRPKRNSMGPSTIPTNHQRYLQSSGNSTLIMSASVYSSPSQSVQTSSKFTSLHTTTESPRATANNKLGLFLSTQPYALAQYDYSSSEPGDLSFKKGDIIILRKKIDSDWCQGECGGATGVLPLSYVKVMIPLPGHVPQCKALFDFRMTNDDEEGCLTFNKGEVIMVIRRVDENWAEGKLGGRIGIFPISFVEMNSVARSLMKLSSNAQPGPSRVAPPTPTSEDATPLIPTDQNWMPLINQFQSSTLIHQTPISHSNAPTSLPAILPAQPAISQHQPVVSPASPSSCSSTTTTPNTTNSSSSNNTSNSSSSSSNDSTPTHCSPISNQHHQNRHSFTSLSTPSMIYPAQRHSVEVLRDPTNLTPQENNPPDTRQAVAQTNSAGLHRHSSQRHRKSATSELAHHSLFLPAPYIALFPYKPQKADELELRKGNTYMVTERCQDGWFKGTSSKPQKSGVFPGNYVAPAKSLPALKAQLRGLGRNQVIISPTSVSPRSDVSSTRNLPQNGKQEGALVVPCTPPELPPRSTSSTPPSASVSSFWHSDSSGCNTTSATSVSSLSGTPKISANVENISPTATSLNNIVVIGPPNLSIVTSPKTSDKTKCKVEKRSVSLMKRLTIMKKSKSPPPASYSMDNPVFEDSISSPPPTSSQHHHVHVRSDSCPSQLLDAASDSSRMLSPSSSHRIKHKERSNVLNHFPSKSSGDTSTNATGPNIHHRKSSSLDADATSVRKVNKQQLVPPIRERFRCIVPYPPNSDIELELQVGDIIYVHKKREDGWYKGTQQRTGRTGLFPASFVESF